jgi:hypothetical protein
MKVDPMLWLKQTSWLEQVPGKRFRRAQGRRRQGCFLPAVEPQDHRLMMAVTALCTAGELNVTSDDPNNAINVSRTTG